MKKILRRIAVLVFIATLFVMPSTTALAASTPVVEFDSDGFTSILYQPDPLFIAGGGSNVQVLSDIRNTTGTWYVPAGKTCYFAFFTSEVNTTFRFVMYKNGVYVSDYVYTSTMNGKQFNITPEGSNNYWTFIIIPYSDLTLKSYAAYIN